MSPLEFMRGRRTALRLVIFDCDGVIVDSEAIANRVAAEMISDLGWKMTGEQAQDNFLGMTLNAMVPIISARIGRPVPRDWLDNLVNTIADAMATQAIAIPGAIEALDGVAALGLPWRIASNSSHQEMQVKFARIGISARGAGRVHSFTDVSHGKPAPDLFLSAAAAEGVDPKNCVVIEDSTTGARAAAAAGMDCLGYLAHGDGTALRATGAVPFRSMFELPSLIRLAPRAFE